MKRMWSILFLSFVCLTISYCHNPQIYLFATDQPSQCNATNSNNVYGVFVQEHAHFNSLARRTRHRHHQCNKKPSEKVPARKPHNNSAPESSHQAGTSRALCEQELADYFDDDWVFHNQASYDRSVKRQEALQATQHSNYTVTKSEYYLPDNTTVLLTQYAYSPADFAHCTGTAIQQQIHQEIVEIVTELGTLHASKVQRPFSADTVLDFAHVSREFNQSGDVLKACVVADFCWAMLDCGKAVLEGALDGAVYAINDMLEHPIQAAACIVAGEYVLAYQLVKVLYNVAELGVLAVADPAQGSKKWDEYLAPVNSVIDAIDKKQISLRDGIKAGTQLVVGFKTQGKLLSGLGKFYKSTKSKAIAFAKKNPAATPQEYMVTPEGIVFKVAGDVASKKNNVGQISTTELKWTNHGYKHVPPKNIPWKEIVKSTVNGDAYYKSGINIKELEFYAWQNGIKTTNGRNWKVFKANEIIGAKRGKETIYIRIECSAHTIHGHPILEHEYLEYIK